jgi:Tol biopolymer transport system component
VKVVIASVVAALALFAGDGRPAAAPSAPLLVVSSDYTKWSDDHAFTYTPGGRLRALALGTGAAASPDGRFVAFIRGNELWTIEADGRGSRRAATLDAQLSYQQNVLWSRDDRHVTVPLVDRTDLVDLQTGDVESVDTIAAAFSPDGAQVAYVDRDGLTVADPRGLNGHVVAPGWTEAGGVAWSADGRWIAFVGLGSNGGARVVVCHPDGTELRTFAPSGAFPGTPSWSPDGRLAWLSSPRLEIATPEGTVRTLARVQGIGWPEPGPAWSSDGRLLAVRTRGRAVALVPTAGWRIRVLHPPAPAQALSGGPSWLGSKLVVSGHKARSDSELELVRADGSGLRALTNNDVADRDPSWAPDGRTIAFVRFGARRHGVYTIGVASGAVRRLTDGPDRAPAFSPDGASLAFVSGTSIRLLDLRAHRSRELATTRLPPRQLSWTPDGTSIVFGDEYGLRRLVVTTRSLSTIDVGTDVFRPLVSPDGSEIAFLSYRDERYYRDPNAWGVFLSSADGTGVRRITSNDKFGPRSWSPDQQLLVSSDGARLEIVHVSTGDRRALLASGRTAEAAFAPTSARGR